MLTHTKAPARYCSGGEMNRSAAWDACDLASLPANCAYSAAIGQGPLDAPEWMPTGRVSVSHGMLFFILTHREA